MPVSTSNVESIDSCSAAKPIANIVTDCRGIRALAFSPDRTLLAAADVAGTVILWEVNHKSPRPRGTIQRVGDAFNALAFTANGRQLAIGSGSLNGFVWLYDVTDKTPQEVGVVRGAKGAIDALAFSPNSQMLAGAGEDRTLRVWECGPQLRSDARSILPGQGGRIRTLAFTPDGQLVATGGDDGTVRLWTISRIRSWEKAVITIGDPVSSVAFSPDGQRLAISGRGVVKVWDVSGIRPTLRLELGRESIGVRQVLATPDHLIGVDAENQVINWEWRSGKVSRAWAIPSEPGAVSALTLDGRYLATRSADGIAIYRVAEKRS